MNLIEVGYGDKQETHHLCRLYFYYIDRYYISQWDIGNSYLPVLCRGLWYVW